MFLDIYVSTCLSSIYLLYHKYKFNLLNMHNVTCIHMILRITTWNWVTKLGSLPGEGLFFIFIFKKIKSCIWDFCIYTCDTVLSFLPHIIFLTSFLPRSFQMIITDQA